MDDSETYIKMCEKAEEIQELRDAKRIGDYFFSQLDIERCVFHNYPYPEQPSHTTAECYAREIITWLPRQDQLQEMVSIKNHTAYVGALYKWLKDNGYDIYYDNVTSNPYFLWSKSN